MEEDDDEEEDEDEEEGGGPMEGQQSHGRRHAARLKLPGQINLARVSPVSFGALRPSDDKSLIDLSVYTNFPRSSGGNGRVVKQLAFPQRTEWAGSAQV